MSTRGLLVIHSCPSALRSHVEWALQNILGKGVNLNWRPQPMVAGTYRTTLEWRGSKSQTEKSECAAIATALRAWHYLRFEVRDENENGGEMFRFTPDLGIHRSAINGAGSIVVDENQILKALDSTFDEEALRTELSQVLGTQWEVELEPLRGVDLQEVQLRAI